jgi:AcrR family transcriptional regulator
VEAGRASRGRADGGARGRILETAYHLFSRHGIHAVGIDTIVAEAQVAKMTLYRHFPSKEALVLAFLELREQRWTRGWLQREVEERASVPAERLLRIFEVLEEWFCRRDYEGCAFIKTLMETHDEDGAVRRAVVGHLATIRALIAGYAVEAGLADPDGAAAQLHSLMMGAIVSASQGDRHAGARSRALAMLVVGR